MRGPINLMIICVVLLMACGFLGGCSAIEQSSEINCLVWAADNVEKDEVIYVGQHTGVKSNLHAWVCGESNVCRDKSGSFWKSDERYKAWNSIDTTSPGVLAELLNNNFRELL